MFIIYIYIYLNSNNELISCGHSSFERMNLSTATKNVLATIVHSPWKDCMKSRSMNIDNGVFEPCAKTGCPTVRIVWDRKFLSKIPLSMFLDRFEDIHQTNPILLYCKSSTLCTASKKYSQVQCNLNVYAPV